MTITFLEGMVLGFIIGFLCGMWFVLAFMEKNDLAFMEKKGATEKDR